MRAMPYGLGEGCPTEAGVDRIEFPQRPSVQPLGQRERPPRPRRVAFDNTRGGLPLICMEAREKHTRPARTRSVLAGWLVGLRGRSDHHVFRADASDDWISIGGLSYILVSRAQGLPFRLLS